MDEDIIIYSTEETGFTIHDMKPKGKDRSKTLGDL